jgi:sRNA-binding carbon storage regulator CsrA
MLVLSRKMNELIEIDPVDELDNTTLREIFANGGIQIKLIKIARNRVSVAIDAPPALRIRRGPASDDSAAVGRDEPDVT